MLHAHFLECYVDVVANRTSFFDSLLAVPDVYQRKEGDLDRAAKTLLLGTADCSSRTYHRSLVPFECLVHTQVGASSAPPSLRGRPVAIFSCSTAPTGSF